MVPGNINELLNTSRLRDILVIVTSQKKDPFTSVSALDPFEQIEVNIEGTEEPEQPCAACGVVIMGRSRLNEASTFLSKWSLAISMSCSIPRARSVK
jgi:hypothetical protein